MPRARYRVGAEIKLSPNHRLPAAPGSGPLVPRGDNCARRAPMLLHWSHEAASEIHTSLWAIKRTWSRVHWLLDYSICKAFDQLNNRVRHQILIKTLGEAFHFPVASGGTYCSPASFTDRQDRHLRGRFSDSYSYGGTLSVTEPCRRLPRLRGRTKAPAQVCVCLPSKLRRPQRAYIICPLCLVMITGGLHELKPSVQVGPLSPVGTPGRVPYGENSRH